MTPCQDPANDANDWFLRKDGKQYDDEPDLEPENLKAALQRRRHAVDKCFTHCYLRNECLRLALDNVEEYGTWGGYTEEQLKKLRREMKRKG